MARSQCRDCQGEVLSGEHCLAHLTEDELVDAIARLREPDPEPLNARGVHISGDGLARVLRRLPLVRGRRQLPTAHFNNAHFLSGADFRDTDFLGDAHFDYARFTGQVRFDKACFGAEADFRNARFTDTAWFKEALFVGEARFGGARFSADVKCERATFRTRASIGPIEVAGKLCLEDVLFEQDARLDTAARMLCCIGARFEGRGDLNVRWAEVALDSATFVYRSRLAGVGPFPGFTETALGREPDADARPRLLSVRQANVENLALDNLDLQACRFFGAHGLDHLRIESSCVFAQPPARWWYTRRRVLAEEHEWRARIGAQGPVASVLRAMEARLPERSGPHSRWYPPECHPAGWLEVHAKARLLDDPLQIASLYRLLRKALEDRKDEPGAADSYYGEMEMRRQAPRERGIGRLTRARGERAMLNVYWILSGYGLRASRAVVWLILLLVAASGFLDAFGFRPDRTYFESLRLAMRSSISPLRAPAVEDMRPSGDVVLILLGLLGPLLVGLALLAVRGRVKR